MEPGSVIFLRTRILRTACEVGLSLIFFGLEPAHVPFWTVHKHFIFSYLQANNYSDHELFNLLAVID